MSTFDKFRATGTRRSYWVVAVIGPDKERRRLLPGRLTWESFDYRRENFRKEFA